MNRHNLITLTLLATVAVAGGAGTGHAQTAAPAVAGQETIAQQEFQARAEAFINRISNQAITQLADPKIPREERVKRFRTFLNANFDIDNIGRFVLGRYARTATPEQLGEYNDLFQQLLTRMYEQKFTEYRGQTLTVTGSRLAAGDNFALVQSQVNDPAQPSPINVEWRVVNRDQMQVADVVVEGISMGLSQRSEFASVIQRNGGSFEALLDVMRKQVATGAPVQPASAAQAVPTAR